MNEPLERAEQVISRHSDMVYKLAFAQLRNRSDADDVYQEVFLRYVRKAPTFESPEHEKAWFLRVTLNCCKKLWASPWRRHSVPLEESIQADMPENHYLTEELKKLPLKYSAMLHLFYWEDMTVDENQRYAGAAPRHGEIPAFQRTGAAAETAERRERPCWNVTIKN